MAIGINSSFLEEGWEDQSNLSEYEKLLRKARSREWQVIGNFLQDHDDPMLLWNGAVHIGYWNDMANSFLNISGANDCYEIENVTHFIRISKIEGPVDA